MTTDSQMQVLLLHKFDVIVLRQLKSHCSQLLYNDLKIASKPA